jgi:hypothetical protein
MRSSCGLAKGRFWSVAHSETRPSQPLRWAHSLRAAVDDAPAPAPTRRVVRGSNHRRAAPPAGRETADTGQQAGRPVGRIFAMVAAVGAGCLVVVAVGRRGLRPRSGTWLALRGRAHGGGSAGIAAPSWAIAAMVRFGIAAFARAPSTTSSNAVPMPKPRDCGRTASVWSSAYPAPSGNVSSQPG